MRILTTNLLAAALLLFGAASASAFAVNMVASTPTTGLTKSDTVIVDVFLDSDGPISIFSVAVVSSDPSALLYDGAASAALPTNPGSGKRASNGSQSSYILYEAVGRSRNYLKPLQTPYFVTFPPETVGTEQVNIHYTENALGTTNATGNGVYIATLLFHIVADFTTANLSLAFTTSNLIQAGTVVVDPNLIGLSAPITLTGVVPEPTTALLIGLGVLGLGFAGRRRV